MASTTHGTSSGYSIQPTSSYTLLPVDTGKMKASINHRALAFQNQQDLVVPRLGLGIRNEHYNRRQNWLRQAEGIQM